MAALIMFADGAPARFSAMFVFTLNEGVFGALYSSNLPWVGTINYQTVTIYVWWHVATAAGAPCCVAEGDEGDVRRA